MDGASLLYLVVTIGLFAIFALIVVKTMSAKRKEANEAAKYRMMEDE